MNITENICLMSSKGRPLSILTKDFENFCDMSIKPLSKHAPIKKKYKRSNQMPLIIKDFLKQLWKDQNLEIIIKKIKLMQTGCHTRSKETTAYSF